MEKFKDSGLNSMAHLMKKQYKYKEEVVHAENFIEYLYERGKRVIIPEIAQPKESSRTHSRSLRQHMLTKFYYNHG